MSLDNYLSARSRDRHGKVFSSSSSLLSNFDTPNKSFETESKPQLSSWLYKRGPIMTWQEVYARITDTGFELFKDQETVEPFWTCSLAQIKSTKSTKTSNDKFEFSIYTLKTEVLLAAESSALRSMWISELDYRISLNSNNKNNETFEAIKNVVKNTPMPLVSTILESSSECEETENSELIQTLESLKRELLEVHQDHRQTISQLQEEIEKTKSNLLKSENEKQKLIKKVEEKPKFDFVTIDHRLSEITRSISSNHNQATNQINSIIDSVKQVDNIKLEIHNVIGSIREIIESQVNVNLKNGFESTGKSLAKVIDFLAKSVELQNMSEKAIHQKIETLTNKSNEPKYESSTIKQDIVALSRQIAIDSAKTTIDRETLSEVVKERTSELLSIYDTLRNELSSISLLQNERFVNNFEAKLDEIRAGIDQTQTMVISSQCPSFDDVLKQLNEVTDSLQNCYSEFTKVSEESVEQEKKTKPSFDLSLIQSGIEKLPELLDNHHKEIIEVIKQSGVETRDRMSRLSTTRQEPPESSYRARSLSPQKNHYETFQESQLTDINRNLISLKDRLNNFFVSQINDAERVKMASQISSIQQSCQQTLGSLRGISDNIRESDSAWKAELRHSMRFSHEKLSDLEKLLQRSNFGDSNALVNIRQSLAQIQKDMSGLKGSSTDDAVLVLVRNLSEEMQEFMSKQVSMYARNLNNIIQDREMLMQENQKLLNAIVSCSNKEAQKGEEEVGELVKAKIEIKEELKEIKQKLEEKKKKLSELELIELRVEDKKNELKQLTSKVEMLKKNLMALELQSASKPANDDLITHLMLEIDTLKAKKKIVENVMQTNETRTKKNRSSSFAN